MVIHLLLRSCRQLGVSCIDVVDSRRPTLVSDRRGGVALLSAFALTAVIGMAGLALDLGTAYAQRARLQKVADSAAMAGAISWTKTGSATSVRATINAVVIANGWPTSVVLQPGKAFLAASPKNSGNPAIQVSLAAPSPLTLARVVSAASSVTTGAYAAVEIGTTKQTACLVALNQLMVNGTINVGGCAVAANGTSSDAVTVISDPIVVNGNGSLTASTISTPGGVVANGKVSGVIKTGAAPAVDPYVNDQNLAAHSGCSSYQNYNPKQAMTPGCWTNVNPSGVLALSAGTYFFQNININPGSSITGVGVTMVVPSGFSPSGPITITAPTTGDWAGVAIYATGDINMNSNVIFNINGAVYAPTGTVTINSGAWNQSACTYLVAYKITLNGGGTFTLPETSCSTAGFPSPTIAGGTKIALVK